LVDTVALTPVSNEGEHYPVKFILYQNYPNPFNPSTKIKFDIPQEIRNQKSEVRLTVYDAAGKQISVLINENLSPGSYEAEWNASEASTGIYFYILTTDGFSETKKMIFLK
jgi:hypothetical protein